MFSKKKTKYKSKFQDSWLEEEEFKVWLQKRKDETQAYCKLCMKSFSISSHGRTSLTTHASGEKHKSKIPSTNQRTLMSLVKTLENKTIEEEKSKTPEEGSSKTIENKTFEKKATSYFIAEDVTDAEILWALDVIVSNSSLNSCQNKSKLFARMFKGCKVAELFSCGYTKCAYIINFGLAPYFRSMLEETVKEAPYHVRCFDESHNKSLQKGQMDMHLRFWDDTTNAVKTRYYNSEFLTKSKASDIQDKFNSCSKDLDSNKMIQVFVYIFQILSSSFSFSVFLFLNIIILQRKIQHKVLCNVKNLG